MVSSTTDALGTAMNDYQRHGEVLGECLYRDGNAAQDARIGEFYFTPREEWSEKTVDLLESLEGPVVDVGCGAGQHSLWLQDRGIESVAFDVSPGAVGAARDRGVEDVRVLDMFEVADEFPRNRFRSALLNGTQVGLAGSMAGVSELLADLARVTDQDGIAVVDNYVPQDLDPDFFGYRPDPRQGIGHRTMHFEYEREAGDGLDRLVGRNLHFVLFDPDRLVEATIGTPWELDRVIPKTAFYKAILRKE